MRRIIVHAGLTAGVALMLLVLTAGVAESVVASRYLGVQREESEVPSKST